MRQPEASSAGTMPFGRIGFDAPFARRGATANKRSGIMPVLGFNSRIILKSSWGCRCIKNSRAGRF